MPMMIAGILLLWLSSYLLRGFLRANPAVLSRRIREAAGAAALGLALFTLLRGEIQVAIAAFGASIWLFGWRRGPVSWFGGSGQGSAWSRARQAQQGQSRVRSRTLEMALDRSTGDVSGLCFAGPAMGRSLDQLTERDCLDLHGWCVVNDPQGARLLEAYFDRRFPTWREATHGRHDTGAGQARARTVADGDMTENEAYKVLGLSPGAGREEITRAHRKLMKRYHPDHGGSTAIAARVNEAKDLLIRRHT